jgi:hypothetical protein
MKPGDILCLENTRFHPGEERNDPAFVAQLAALGDIFVNDAFSVAHRGDSSSSWPLVCPLIIFDARSLTSFRSGLTLRADQMIE